MLMDLNQKNSVHTGPIEINGGFLLCDHLRSQPTSTLTNSWAILHKTSIVWIIQVFPKVDHSGNDARIVLEQNKFSKKQGLNPQPHVCSIYSIMPIQPC